MVEELRPGDQEGSLLFGRPAKLTVQAGGEKGPVCSLLAGKATELEVACLASETQRHSCIGRLDGEPRNVQRAPIHDPAGATLAAGSKKEADLAAKRCKIGKSLYALQTIMTGSMMQAKERRDVLICRETARRAVKRPVVLPASRQRAPAD